METDESTDSKLEFDLSASSHTEKLERTMQRQVTARGSPLIKENTDRKMEFWAQSFHFWVRPRKEYNQN